MTKSLFQVMRDYYDIPDLAKLPELVINLSLGYVGTSSLNSVTELVDKTTGKVYAKNTNTVVSVDKTTRKPTPLPDWWKEKYESHVIGNQRLINPPLKVPENVYNHRTTVTWSDIDGYRHTNYVVYIRFCFDAAMDAIHNGKLKGFDTDIALYHTKDMQALYKGESNAGQELNVALWQNELNPLKLHFDITRDGESIFQATLEFYPRARE